MLPSEPTGRPRRVPRGPIAPFGRSKRPAGNPSGASLRSPGSPAGRLALRASRSVPSGGRAGGLSRGSSCAFARFGAGFARRVLLRCPLWGRGCQGTFCPLRGRGCHAPLWPLWGRVPGCPLWGRGCQGTICPLLGQAWSRCFRPRALLLLLATFGRFALASEGSSVHLEPVDGS